jgi:hypothetical protein
MICRRRSQTGNQHGSNQKQRFFHIFTFLKKYITKINRVRYFSNPHNPSNP